MRPADMRLVPVAYRRRRGSLRIVGGRTTAATGNPVPPEAARVRCYDCELCAYGQAIDWMTRSLVW